MFFFFFPFYLAYMQLDLSQQPIDLSKNKIGVHKIRKNSKRQCNKKDNEWNENNWLL